MIVSREDAKAQSFIVGLAITLPMKIKFLVHLCSLFNTSNYLAQRRKDAKKDS